MWRVISSYLYVHRSIKKKKKNKKGAQGSKLSSVSQHVVHVIFFPFLFNTEMCNLFLSQSVP